jgi:flavin reductase (DIM6/NTAB) family NADH-FMN oxidoreductase RutF
MVGRAFRKAAAKFATGITVVLVNTPEGIHGMTANAFMSVSLEPMTIAVSIANHTRMHQWLKARGTPFTISVLAAQQKLLSDAFAGRMDPKTLENPFESLDGGVVIREAAAWFHCVRGDAFVSGDHTITVGHVEAFGYSARDPLIFYEGKYYLGFDFSIPDTHWKQLTDPEPS